MRNSILIIQSEQRITGTSSDFIYSPKVINTGEIKKYRLNKVVVPYSYYNLKNQTFQFYFGEVGPIVMDILAGTYNAYELATLMQDTLRISADTDTIFVSYNANTNNYTVYTEPSQTFRFQFTAIDGNPDLNAYSIGVQMGFVQANNIDETLPVSSFYTTRFAANASATNNIYVKSNALSVYDLAYFRGKHANVLASVPVNVNPFNWIIYTEFSPIFFDFDRQQLGQIDVQFLDDFGNILDFRGLNTTLELEVVF
jgi:hypothetical protein